MALLRERDDAAGLAAEIGPVVETVLRELAPGSVDLVNPEPSLDRALDALVAINAVANGWIAGQPRGDATVGAFVRALDDPDGPLLFQDSGGELGGVEIVAADTAAGRRWRFAVVPSCVEGEYPRVNATIEWFDAAMTTPIGPLDVAERRRVEVAEQACRSY